MPELPEVETIKTDLEKEIISKQIKQVDVKRPALIKEPSVKTFQKKLKAAKVEQLIRKGKGLIIVFDSIELVVHLRMSGGLVYRSYKHKKEHEWLRTEGKKVKSISPAAEADKYGRVFFLFEDGSELIYTDRRCLGELRLTKDHNSLKFFAKLGPEPFNLKTKDFIEMLKTKQTKIKALLLDQHFIAGIGNIYVQEALFRAKIYPSRKANELNDLEAKALLKELKHVLRLGIKTRGSTIDAYRDGKGQSGQMAQYHLVYGKENQPCSICKSPIQKQTIGGRGTCYCSNCQK